VTPELLERARALAAGALTPAAPRDATTVVLLREEPADGLQVHLQLRPTSMAFAAGVWVFPGGRLEPADAGVAVDLPSHWADLLAGGDAALAAALVVAGVRETFEEAGALLGGLAVPADPLPARSGPFAEVVAGARLATHGMAPWARWVTPELEPRRYDTRFLVAALPEGQQTAGDDAGGEAEATVWLTPQQALDRRAEETMVLMRPTAFALAELTAYDTVEAVLVAAQQRDCAPVLPRFLVEGETLRLALPGERA